jgi:hypothetical protein
MAAKEKNMVQVAIVIATRVGAFLAAMICISFPIFVHDPSS